MLFLGTVEEVWMGSLAYLFLQDSRRMSVSWLKLGLNMASEELMRCTFNSGRSYHCTLEENDDVAGIEAKKLLVSVRYDGPQTLVILALLRVGMTIMASRVARRWKYDIDGGE